jgi:hypothetical protein
MVPEKINLTYQLYRARVFYSVYLERETPLQNEERANQSVIDTPNVDTCTP